MVPGIADIRQRAEGECGRAPGIGMHQRDIRVRMRDRGIPDRRHMPPVNDKPQPVAALDDMPRGQPVIPRDNKRRTNPALDLFAFFELQPDIAPAGRGQGTARRTARILNRRSFICGAAWTVFRRRLQKIATPLEQPGQHKGRHGAEYSQFFRRKRAHDR